MKKTRILLLCAAALLTVSCSSNKNSSKTETAPVSVNESQMNSFVSKLMKQMTLEEKLGQISLAAAPTEIFTGSAATDNILEGIRNGSIGNVLNVFGVESVREYQRVAVEESRLGIPMLFGLDVIHGHRTVFPIPLALASSWDMEAIRGVARVSATEASADGVNWVYSPMVDISRDPRWGRVAEGAGEDPFLGGEIAKAMVLGYQGEPGHQYENNNEVMACVKHFALYGAAEAGRDYNSTDMSLNRMYNEYLPPYKAAVEAGADSFMNSFNDINGLPATANKWLLTELLRNQWGFGGFVVTDYTSISEMIAHGMGDLKTVSELAINAGVDMDMVSPGFYSELPNSIADGSVKMAAIDQACRRVLEAKYKLGLFDDPYKFCDPERNDKDVYTQEHRDFARKVAGESIVLLKNAAVKGTPVLPLKKKGTIAVIGPLADAGSEMMGTWAVSAFPSYASIIEGVKEVGGEDVKVVSARGSFLYDDPKVERNFTSEAFERDGRSSSDLLR
ncbi:MAG: beta-glucosidase, partial [Bacteroidales bacterium]|nr:beta-glucosidase [Bacteroidales bacterium]